MGPAGRGWATVTDMAGAAPTPLSPELAALWARLGPLAPLVPVATPQQGPPRYAGDCTDADLAPLVGAGLLAAQFVRRCLVCPHCGVDRLRISEACPACAAQDLDDVTLVYHFACAAVFPLAEGADAALRCPKCGEQGTLGQPGFEPSGVLAHCRACGRDSPEAVPSLECPGCGWSGTAEQAPFVRVQHYVLTTAGEALLAEQAR